MKKLFLLIIPFILFSSTFPDFSPCYSKYSYIKKSVPVTKHLSITFDKTGCKAYDPFTGMCVIPAENPKTVEFVNSPKLGWWCASIKRGEIYVGNFAKDEIFFNPAQLSVKSQKNSIISDMFCRAVGIGKGDGFIRGDMVKHFVKYFYWGDVGIEVDEDMNVISFDPFYVKNINLKDRLLKINSKPANVQTFMDCIIKGKEGTYVLLNINGKNIKVKIRKKKYLYTPLEHFGIKVDKKLRIVSLPDNIKNRYFITKGAVITGVNSKSVKTFGELKKALSSYKNVTITIMQQGIKINVSLR